VNDITRGLVRVEEGPEPAVFRPVEQASSDEQLVALWLHGRSVHTQRAYRFDVEHFRAFVAKPLRQVTLGDVQAFADSLESLAPATRARRLSAVKSLVAFGHRLGSLTFHVGGVVSLPRARTRSPN
jgi:integrase/recombinase XerD